MTSILTPHNADAAPKIHAIPRQIFRAYDIRGRVELLTPDLVYQIAWALGQGFIENGQQQVVVGHDARLTSPALARIMAHGLRQQGLLVTCIGLTSSPMLYFSAQQRQGNGIMITASHNPPSDNGIKWLMAGRPPTPEQIQHLAEQLPSIEAPTHLGRVDKVTDTTFAAYVNWISRDIQLQPAQVCIDGLNGSAGQIAQAVAQAMGLAVTALHCEPDGHFPLGAPDPSDQARLRELIASVKQHHAAMGMALDGDGDRLVLIDEQGQWVSPDRLMNLLAKICLLAHPGAEIVCDVKCSSQLTHTVKRYGGRLTMIRTGSSFLRNYLLAHGAAFGGEYAGHYVFNDGRGLGFDDGLYAALRVLEYLQQTGQQLSEALAEFQPRLATDDLYIPCNGMALEALTRCLEQHCQHHAQLKTISRVDGLRLDFDDGFGLIRASNTGDYFTLRLDGGSPAQLQQIGECFADALQADHPALANQIIQVTQAALSGQQP